MAYGVARNRVSGASGDVGRVSRGGGEGLTPGGRFVSRSAPDTAPVDDESSEQRLRERRFSNPPSASGYHVTTVAPSTTSSTAQVVAIISPWLIFLLCWREHLKLHHHPSRLTNSCLLVVNLSQISISQPMGRV
jgi:hypothetical protein